MRTLKPTAHLLVNGTLLLGLISLLFANLVLVSDLPSLLYTPGQQKYITYNLRRRISQAAPTWNIITPEGAIESAIFSEWESRVRATLDAHHEKQEGISAAIYDLDFSSEYRLAYAGPPSSTLIELVFAFPSNLDIVHGVHFLVDGEEPPDVQYSVQGIRWQTTLRAGEKHRISIGYQARGVDSFSYGLYRGRRSDVDIQITVLGLRESEILRSSLPPTGSESIDGGEVFAWKYEALIADRDIELALPAQSSIRQRVAQMQHDFRALAGLAPLLVSLFLASLAVLLQWDGVRLGLVAYLLIGWSLALFYPMLTLLSALLGVIPAAALTLLLVSGLIMLFLGLTAGWRRTAWCAGWLLVIFLGVLSLGTLTPWTGLALVTGGLLLLGPFMVAYARRPVAPKPEPAPPPSPTPVEVEPESASRHCPHCGQVLADGFSFCPGCGQDAHHFRRCTGCGHEQFVPSDLTPIHCIHCGQSLS